MGRRRTRRVQYFPELVVNKILNNDFLRLLVYLVYSSRTPQSAGALARQISRLAGREYSHAYVSSYLRRLERWGVVRPYRDPSNGRLLWWIADTRAAGMLREELRRAEMKRILEAVRGDPGATY